MILQLRKRVAGMLEKGEALPNASAKAQLRTEITTVPMRLDAIDKKLAILMREIAASRVGSSAGAPECASPQHFFDKQDPLAV